MVRNFAIVGAQMERNTLINASETSYKEDWIQFFLS